MKFLMSLAVAAAMMFVISPLPAQEILGYEQVCNGSTCSYRPIYAAPRFVKTVHFAGIAESESAQSAAPTIRMASTERLISAGGILGPAINPVYTQAELEGIEGYLGSIPGQSAPLKAGNFVVSASAPIVTASTCNCAATGVCSCDPATCACASCVNGQRRLAMASLQASTSMSALLPGPSERIITTPTGHVHVFTDALGNVATMHCGGHQQRRVARQERWRGRNGIQ